MSEKFVELKAKCLTTRNEIVKRLLELPEDVEIFSEGRYCGGYGYSIRPHVVLDFDKERNSVVLKHIEYEADESKELEFVEKQILTNYGTKNLERLIEYYTDYKLYVNRGDCSVAIKQTKLIVKELYKNFDIEVITDKDLKIFLFVCRES